MSEEFFERLGTAIPQKKTLAEQVNQTEQPTLAKNKSLWDNAREKFGVSGLGENTNRLWLVSDNLYYEGKAVKRELPSGLYETEETNSGVCLALQNNNTDELVYPPDNAIESILDEFDLFWAVRDKFKSRGLLHKRGFLLWGPAGSGKTCLIRLLSKSLIEKHNGLILKITNPLLAMVGISIIRRIEPARPLILLLEDLDALIEKWGEPQFLSLLDGEDQNENLVSIATTNYPERLDARILNRPSRFDKIIKISMPSAIVRRTFIKAKEPDMPEREVDEWVKVSEGFSLAHVKEMIVAVKCLGQPLNEVAKRLKEMRIKSKSDNEFGKVGFTD